MDRRKIGVIAIVIAVVGLVFAYLLIWQATNQRVVGPFANGG